MSNTQYTSNSNFCPKPVAELITTKYHFVIPSYQRGYRWEEKQVIDLLEDICEFAKQDKEDSYYLQPLVVKPCKWTDTDGVQIDAWEVLDGQQRLTTLRLILMFIFEYGLMPLEKKIFTPDKIYNLTYTNRPQLDFENPKPQDNIDSYYLAVAKNVIEKWFTNHIYDGVMNSIKDCLLLPNNSKQVKFIWYVVSEEKQAIESIQVFNRLNKGKISLTILKEDNVAQMCQRIAEHVTTKLQEVSNNTLNKIREMNPELANSLSPNIPSFTDLKWSDLFKNVSIAGDDDIPINKRGSGVKRLILLNFFRAEVERMQSNTESDGLIYAIEEPETSQHVAHQKILMKALIDLANNENVQVILTTHSSYIVKQLKFDNIRLIKEIDGRKVVQNVELSQLPYPSLNEINFTSFGEVTEEYHDELYSYLYSNKTDEVRWIEEYINGKPTVNYIRELQNGSTKEEQKTLTEKIRHQIHHPENCHNAPYTEADIRQSIEDMRTFIMNKRES